MSKRFMCKKPLGTILIDKGICTMEQITLCVKKQKQLYLNIMPKKCLGNAAMVSEARLVRGQELLLGEILIRHSFATEEQVDEALEEQRKCARPVEFVKTENLRKIFDINSVVNKSMNLSVVLSTIMDHVDYVTNSTASTLMLLEEKTGELVFSVPTGPKEGELIDIKLKPGEGVAGWVATHEKPVLINDTRNDFRTSSRIDQMSGFETRNLICVPLMTKGKLIGVLEVMNKSENQDFTEEDLLLLQLFSDKAAIAIDNARMFHNLELFNNSLQKKVKQRTKELESAVIELESLANLDGLTQIPNRRKFDEYIDRECSRHNRDRSPISIIMCDVDCFKLYNDHYGHQAGDECLKAIASVIQNNSRRPGDLAARYGGEEFAVVLPDTNTKGALDLAEQIRKEVCNLKLEHTLSPVNNHVTLSLGVATADQTTNATSQSILASADRALYRAKKQGRNRVVLGNNA